MTVLRVRDTGPRRPGAPAVLLLHAFPCDGGLWAAQQDALADAGHRVLVPDLPGFGASALLPGAPSLADVADAVAGALAERDVPTAVVAGSSLGGYVAMALLRRHPGRVSGLGLVGTKATADTSEAAERRRAVAALVEASPEGCAALLARGVLPGLLGPTSRRERPHLVRRVSRWIDAVPPATVAWYQRAMADRPDSVGLLGAAGIPAVVAFGTEDTLSPPAEQQVMAAALPQAAVVAVHRAGHLLPIEAPAAVSDALAELVGQVTGPRPA